MSSSSTTGAARPGGAPWRAHLLADLGLVGVEDRHDAEAVVGEDVRGGDRLAEVAGAEQRDVVLAGGAQDLADLRDQRVDVVADPALAELAEARQVAPDLRRVDVRVLGQLLGGDRLLAHLARLREHLQVARQARGDAERQAVGPWPIAVAVAGWPGRAHRASTIASFEQAGSSTKKSDSSRAVERDHRDALQVAGVQGVVGADVDLLEANGVGAHALEHDPRVVAQVAARAARRA